MRSTTLPGSPRSTNSVSHMLRAGCSGGMLSAVKLYQSLSTSGPSATVKPRPTNTSSSCSWVWVTRWRWPALRTGRHLGEVEALGSPMRSLRGQGRRSSARRCARASATARGRLVQRLRRPPCGVVGIERAEAGCFSAERPTALPSVWSTDRGRSRVDGPPMLARRLGSGRGARCACRSGREPCSISRDHPGESTSRRRLAAPTTRAIHEARRWRATSKQRTAPRHGHVQRLGPARHRDRDHLVDRR